MQARLFLLSDVQAKAELAMLTKYDLTNKGGDWALTKQGGQRATEVFRGSTKEEAIRQTAHRLSDSGSSLNIHKVNGMFQEERTYPRSADPRRSKG
jgi:hypothetical protein